MAELDAHDTDDWWKARRGVGLHAVSFVLRKPEPLGTE